MENKQKIDEKINADLRILDDFANSFAIDRRLFYAEISVNIAYCNALFHAGILNRMESDKIKNTLLTLKKRASFDRSYFDSFPAENIHSFVEARLVQLLGDSALKIKTGKSRIEQFSTAFRYWLCKEIEKISKTVSDLQKALIQKAFEEKETILPGYVNFKNEHPILFGHWILAYFEMFSRDRERLDEVWRRTNVLPLGAGKIAGTSFEIDYEEIAGELGFEGVKSNSIDAVSDFDFAVEFINACALILQHLTRLSEDFSLFSSDKNNFISFNTPNNSERIPSEKFTNSLRLIRAKTGRVFGNQTSIQTNLKGMSMSFNRDLQENVEIVFDSVDNLYVCLNVMKNICSNFSVNREISKIAASKGFCVSDEIADYLIHRGVSYRSAKNIANKIVSFSKANKISVGEISFEEFKQFSIGFQEDIFDVLKFENMVESKDQLGGTSTERVFAALEKAQASLDRE